MAQGYNIMTGPKHRFTPKKAEPRSIHRFLGKSSRAISTTLGRARVIHSPRSPQFTERSVRDIRVDNQREPWIDSRPREAAELSN